MRILNLIKLLLATVFLMWFTSSMAAQPLPANQAFQFSINFSTADRILAEWRIAPGYYLYTKRTHINSADPNAIEVIYPQGEFKYDSVRGRFEAYANSVSIPILLKQTKQSNFVLGIDYQGCSQDGFCYPPMHKNINVDMTAHTWTEADTAKPMATSATLLTNQNSILSLLHTQHNFIILLMFVGLGLLLAFTPCVLPMVPILTSIIVGQKQATTQKALLLSCIYVLGTAITYAVAGMIAAMMGSSLQAWLQQPWIIVVTSLLFIGLAGSLFGFYEVRAPRIWQNHLTNLSNKQKGGQYIGVFLMGMLSTLIISPCVTAPLVGILIYIGETGNLFFGASSLFALGIGMGLPLILVGVSAGKWLPKSGMWMEVIKKLFGVMMLAMAVWVLSRILAPNIIFILWGIILLIIAVYLGVYLPRMIGQSRFNRGFGFIVGMSGMFLMIGGVGAPNFMNQLVNGKASANFTVVTDVKDLQHQLLLAKNQNKKVLVDFYADWCESCVAMEHKVFNKAPVQDALKNYILLRADLSANTSSDVVLLKSFNIIAPPTILFFDAKGKEINSERIVGEISASEFLARINH